MMKSPPGFRMRDNSFRKAFWSNITWNVDWVVIVGKEESLNGIYSAVAFIRCWLRIPLRYFQKIFWRSSVIFI